MYIYDMYHCGVDPCRYLSIKAHADRYLSLFACDLHRSSPNGPGPMEPRAEGGERQIAPTFEGGKY